MKDKGYPPIILSKGAKPLNERRTPYEEDLERNKPGIEHGLMGHTGFRCARCAAESLNPIKVFSMDSREDRYQNALIKWGEACDAIQNDFDQRSADHWPDHQPVNCDACPKTNPMPIKPKLQFEKMP